MADGVTFQVSRRRHQGEKKKEKTPKPRFVLLLLLVSWQHGAEDDGQLQGSLKVCQYQSRVATAEVSRRRGSVRGLTHEKGLLSFLEESMHLKKLGGVTF